MSTPVQMNAPPLFLPRNVADFDEYCETGSVLTFSFSG